MRTPKFLASVFIAGAIVAAATTLSHAQEQHRPPGPILTPLGTSSSQIMFSKVTVSDLKKSYDFYTKVIGLKRAAALGQPLPPEPGSTNTPQPAFVEIALNFTGSVADPFFVIVARQGEKPTPDAAKISWVGFKVPDAVVAVRRVKEAGYEVVREPKPAGPGEMSIGIVHDPDGYSLELIQAANYPPASR
jgi:lactoylglutathione lyase